MINDVRGFHFLLKIIRVNDIIRVIFSSKRNQYQIMTIAQKIKYLRFFKGIYYDVLKMAEVCSSKG